MPNVLKETTDKQTSVITISLPRTDYEKDFTDQLKRYRRDAHIKGFRKGKVPMSFIRKNYGQSILADVINKKMQEEIYKVIDEDGANHLGQPVAIEDQTQYTFDATNLEDFEFKFEVGVKPEFEVGGVDKKKAFTYYDVTIPSDTIDEEIANAQKRAGERFLDEEKIEEGDLVRFDAKELDADGKVKEDGVSNEFSLMWSRIADEDLKATLLKSKKGDKVTFNVFNAELDTKPDYVKKYLLGMDAEAVDGGAEVNEMFEAEITEASRIIPAELNEEFFTGQFGEEIKTEEEARAFIEGEIKKSFDQNADALLFRDVQEYLMDSNSANVTLPDDFMKRFLAVQSEENTPETIEKGYDDFAKGLRWTLIRSQLYDRYEVKVEDADLRERFMQQIRQYMGGYGDPSMLNGMVERMMGDRNAVENTAEAIATERLMLKLKDDLKLNKKAVSMEEFNKIVEEANAQAKAEREAAQEEE